MKAWIRHCIFVTTEKVSLVDDVQRQQTAEMMVVRPLCVDEARCTLSTASYSSQGTWWRPVARRSVMNYHHQGLTTSSLPTYRSRTSASSAAANNTTRLLLFIFIYSFNCTAISTSSRLMPMTHAPETGTRNRRQKTGVGFWRVCHTIWCRIFLAPDSGVG